MKKCPYCAEEIQDDAIKCKYCREMLAKQSEKLLPKATAIPKKKIGFWGWVGIYFLTAWAFLLIINFITNSDSNQRSESTTSSVAIESKHQEQASTNKERKPDKIYKEGDTVNVGYTSYAVQESRWSNYLSNNPYLNEKPNAMFLFADLIVRNDDNKPRTIPPFYLIDENGAEYETSSKSWQVEGSIGTLDSLNPKVQQRGYIVFDVPSNHKYKLKVSGGYWSGENALIELSPKN